MHSRCTGCIVKPADRSLHDRERPTEPLAVVRIVQPSRCAARMRQRNQGAIAVGATPSHDVAQRNASPEAFDRDSSNEQDDARSNERELSVEPRCAERDLRWRWTAIPSSTRRLSGKAFRDRGAVGQMPFIDAALAEPAPQLSARASREWKTGRDLDRTGRLADDHHAIAGLARDDRECRGQIARLDALGAGTDAHM